MTRCLVCQKPNAERVRVYLDTPIVIFMCRHDQHRWTSFGIDLEEITTPAPESEDCLPDLPGSGGVAAVPNSMRTGLSG